MRDILTPELLLFLKLREARVINPLRDKHEINKSTPFRQKSLTLTVSCPDTNSIRRHNWKGLENKHLQSVVNLLKIFRKDRHIKLEFRSCFSLGLKFSFIDI